MTEVLNREDIEKYIPHRYENLLLDSVEINDEEGLAGHLELTIGPDDELGRDIFLSTYSNERSIISVPVYAEVMALVSIVSSKSRLKEGYTTIFAGISNFQRLDLAQSSQVLNGEMTLVTDRKGFYKYQGQLTSGDKVVCSSQLTAFYTPSDNLLNEEPSDLDTLDIAAMTAIDKSNRSKLDSMFICDGYNQITEDSFVMEYTYPEDHPLVKGHFPNQAVMMGIMQWMSVEDSFCVYLEQNKKSGQRKWKGSFKLVDRYNRAVADINDIELDSWIECEGTVNQVHTRSVKRILFKKIVNPGETLFIQSTYIEEL